MHTVATDRPEFSSLGADSKLTAVVVSTILALLNGFAFGGRRGWASTVHRWKDTDLYTLSSEVLLTGFCS